MNQWLDRARRMFETVLSDVKQHAKLQEITPRHALLLTVS